MLIKLQKTRFSLEYMVIENARNVTYRDKPLFYYSEGDLLKGMQDFLGPRVGNCKVSCWYQVEEDGSGHDGYQLEFASGYAINQISFTNENGQPEEIRFDGEAFICNDDGKTIHRIKVGGCPSTYQGSPVLAANG